MMYQEDLDEKKAKFIRKSADCQLEVIPGCRKVCHIGSLSGLQQTSAQSGC